MNEAMKMKRLQMFALLMAGMIAIVSCDKDDPKDLSKEEAQLLINNAEKDLQARMDEIAATDGYKIQAHFGRMITPFDTKSLPTQEENATLAQKLLSAASQNFLQKNSELEFYFEKFLISNFNEVKGTWSWTPNGWNRELTPTDKVILKFPYPQSSATNNVTITYYDFSSTLLNGQTVPTGIKARIEYNGKQVFTLAVSITITNMLKRSVKFDIAFGPFTISFEDSFDASVNNKVLYEKNSVGKKDGKAFYGENANVSLTIVSNQSADILITAKQFIGKLEFRIKLEANTSQFENMNPNDLAALSLYTTSGDKLGDFVFVNENDEWVLYFKFNNGERVKAETLMPLMFERLSYFFNDLLGAVLHTK